MIDWARPRQSGTHRVSGPGREEGEEEEERYLHSRAEAVLPEDTAVRRSAI